MARQLFIFNVMSVFGYYNEFNFELSKENGQIFYK